MSPGESNRLLKWSGPPLSVAICYELSDGNTLAKSVLDGGEAIISIANLDPYPESLQKQFISLAKLRAIETDRELIIAANTGPSALITSNGAVSKKIPSFQENIAIFDLNKRYNITPYVKFRELPLLILIFTSLGILLTIKRV